MGKATNVMEVKQEVQENHPVTVKEFMDLLSKADPNAVLSIRIDSDYDIEQDSVVMSDSLKENMYSYKEDYLFSTNKKEQKNFIVIDVCNF
mgnify:FL=1